MNSRHIRCCPSRYRCGFLTLKLALPRLTVEKLLARLPGSYKLDETKAWVSELRLVVRLCTDQWLPSFPRRVL